MSRASVVRHAVLLVATCALSVRECAGTILDVRDFGAIGDGVRNDASALNRAVAEGDRLGPGTTVLIPTGRYHLENFVVRNNTFVNCDTRCIDIGAADAGEQCAMRENRDILIEGNTFKHSGTHETIHRGFVPHCPIAVAHSDGVIIRLPDGAVNRR